MSESSAAETLTIVHLLSRAPGDQDPRPTRRCQPRPMVVPQPTPACSTCRRSMTNRRFRTTFDLQTTLHVALTITSVLVRHGAGGRDRTDDLPLTSCLTAERCARRGLTWSEPNGTRTVRCLCL